MRIKHILTLTTLGLVTALGGFMVREMPSVEAKVGDGLPAGVYATTISAGDLQSLPPEVVAILVGEWKIEFTESGSYLVTKDGEIVVVGRYTSSSQNLVMTDLSGTLSCTDEPGIATGVYQWSLENNELVLTSIRDRCFGRPIVLTAHALQKQQ